MHAQTYLTEGSTPQHLPSPIELGCGLWRITGLFERVYDRLGLIDDVLNYGAGLELCLVEVLSDVLRDSLDR